MPDCFTGWAIGILSLLAIYYLYTRCDQFENGNIDRKD